MNGVFSLRGHDVPCRSVFGTELPFPITENLTDARFLIGGNRPVPALPGSLPNGENAATPVVHALRPVLTLSAKLGLIAEE